MSNIPFPQKPNIDVSSITKVNVKYRSNVIRVLLSILLFIFGYLLILIGGVFLIYYGGVAAINVMLVQAHWVTLLIAAGIMIMVIMFFVFLIKFLFKVKKDENPNRVEIKENDQPELFEFVKRTCQEARAPFPKKIFLSPSVNACVFYNSSFLSMFFSVRKNLEIGLGMVNTLSVSEFKAVLAHEFGHFSQSSTKLGVYVYRLNKMIFNLLYDNTGWSETLNSMVSVHAILTFFGNITVWMVNVVLKIFVKLYEIINLSFMSLSREMEFHADLVAVSVTGSESIIKALYRIEFGQGAYSYTLSVFKEYYDKNKKLPDNFFIFQTRALAYLAKENNLEVENGLPLIDTIKYNEIVIPERIFFNDAWSSHPPIKEREKNAKNTYVSSEEINTSAWALFRDKEKLEEVISQKIYQNEMGIKTKGKIETSTMVNYFSEKEKQKFSNPVYHDFYEHAGQTYALPETSDTLVIEKVDSLTIGDLFNKEITLKVKRQHKINHDIATIKSINDGVLKVKKFEFDGKIRSLEDTSSIYSQLKKEAYEEEQWLKLHKLKISTWFYRRLLKKHIVDAVSYQELMDFRMKMGMDRDPFLQLYQNLLNFYFALQNSQEDIHTAETKLKSYYNLFIAKKGEVIERQIPKICSENNILSKGYKQTLFEKEIRPIKDLNGLVPFVEDLQKLIENFTAIDDEVFKLVLSLQEKVIVES